ncbi:MAG: hypothetical protein LBQ40_04705 [Clostridiales bacterium]|jgi:N-glycosylase/DNA lyase|nr:hypothetical protein [Clostridiales bacterium]
MDYMTVNNDIYIKKDKLDIEKTALSGQVFRYFKNDGGGYTLLSKGYAADCRFCTAADGADKGDFVKLSTNNSEYFINYFDLAENYDIIESKYSDNAVISAAAAYAKGMRMLRQDPFETLISFIISANNNIPRIRMIIERLCSAAGRDIDGKNYKAFPSASDMKDLGEDFFEKIGAGYRAAYLRSTIGAVNDGFDLSKPFRLDTPSAREYLLGLKGVGPKVADCILLFAYGKRDVFPVDTWIKKSVKEFFGIDCPDAKKISRSLVALFGDDSGIIQQYIYYYARGKTLS